VIQFVQNGGTVVFVGYKRLLPEDVDEETRAAFLDMLPASPTAETFSVADMEVSAKHPAVVDVNWKKQPAVEYFKAQARGDARKTAGGISWVAKQDDGEVVFVPFAGSLADNLPWVKWAVDGRLVPGALRWGAREKFRGGGLSERNLWLVSLSLLVCIVGITNAMLMSVTERFREIGTMKCLGALDRFVVRLFLIESSFQGAAGSLLGAFIGLGLSFFRALFSYRIKDLDTGEMHWLTLHHFPWGTALVWTGIAIAVGIILSIVAAIYPAYRAARMEPVEAMRAEA
jgi:hypothetical protein